MTHRFHADGESGKTVDKLSTVPTRSDDLEAYDLLQESWIDRVNHDTLILLIRFLECSYSRSVHSVAFSRTIMLRFCLEPCCFASASAGQTSYSICESEL